MENIHPYPRCQEYFGCGRISSFSLRGGSDPRIATNHQMAIKQRIRQVADLTNNQLAGLFRS